MGFSNGLLSVRTERGEKGDRGQGFRLTADQHFHLEDKRLTNLAPPVDKNDAMTKGHLTNALKAKAGTNYVNKELAKKANKSDLKAEAKSYITVWAEESGSLRQGKLQWSFGDGSKNNSNYAWPSPADGKIIHGSICGCSGSNQAAEIIVCLVHNGSDKTDYEITKPANSWSNHTTFRTPLDVKVGNRINFRSKTTNSSVTHAIVNILIEIDI